MQAKQIIRIIRMTQLEVGMIAHFYGARFEITSTKIVDHNTCEAPTEATDERDIVMVANGKWIDGAIITGYFGPDKDWNFQGNKLASVTVEV